ncbi:MAG: hypothetical protein P4L87_10045, partial [Formivibrio sp.]|nr:hypothetical protein [Formivibrio sp.]
MYDTAISPNPDYGLPGNDENIYQYTFHFKSLAWTRATAGDTITLRAYSPLVYAVPNAYDLQRGSLCVA